VIGFLADHVIHKDRMLVLTKVIQAGLYLVLALVIDARTLVVFTVVVAINLVSDCLGFLSSSLRLPVIRERVARDDRQQVLGLNQSIASLLQPVGQSIGVFVLAVTHDYALAALINAGTFLIAALILFVGRRAIHIAPAENETGPVHFQFLGYVLQSNHFIESKHAVCWWCQCRRSTVGVLSCAGKARKVNARRWRWKVERAEAKSEE